MQKMEGNTAGRRLGRPEGKSRRLGGCRWGRRRWWLGRRRMGWGRRLEQPRPGGLHCIDAAADTVDHGGQGLQGDGRPDVVEAEEMVGTSTGEDGGGADGAGAGGGSLDVGREPDISDTKLLGTLALPGIGWRL